MYIKVQNKRFMRESATRFLNPVCFRILTHFSYAEVFSHVVPIYSHVQKSENLRGVVDTAESDSAVLLAPRSQIIFLSWPLVAIKEIVSH